MNKRIFLFSIVFLSVLALASAQTTVHYFYGDGCPHCAIIAESGILEIVQKDNVSVIKHEIYHNVEDRNLFNNFTETLGISSYSRGVPMAVIDCNGNLSYLLGDTPILNDLQKTIEICGIGNAGTGGVSPDNPSNQQITLWTIIFGALIDSINPCAFAVLVFLLIGLLSAGSRKRMIKISIVYIVTVYLTYFLAGLGLFKAIQSLTSITHIIYIASGVIVIAAGLIEIKDFFWYGKGITLQIPTKLQPFVHRLAEKGSLPAAILMGFLVSLFELPCTGGIYLAILTMMSMNKTFALSYLLIYNLIFILPLIVITFIVFHGTKPELVDKWRLKERRWMKLAAGIVLVALGLYILLF